jgi:peptidoglycan/LPS O-acetylase OafA/YrhL
VGVQYEYRADVDGLRAVAVLAVLGFHAFPRHLGGGFVGVDIFFVISGFLISGLIRKEIEEGTFSLATFYARRIKRIFPALIAVSAACIFVGGLILTADEFKSLGKHIAAGAAFLANFALLQEVGYFDTSAELKPLLHLWSLGVEEQFYLVWPLLMLLCWRTKGGPILIAVLVLAGSFVCNVVIAGRSPAAAFYLPVTRFWELMLGALLAFATSYGVRGYDPILRLRAAFARTSDHSVAMLQNGAAVLGAVALAAGVIMIRREEAYPGWWALCPTLGAVLIIAAGSKAWINQRLLAHPALVYIGLISYPLYLWHWPILVFERMVRLKDPTDLLKIAGLGAAFILAALTYKFIERPIRFGPPRGYKPIGAAITLALIGCLGLLIEGWNGWPLRMPSTFASAAAAESASDATKAYRRGRCFLADEDATFKFVPECDGSPGNLAGKIVLWGDSHAAHLYPGLHEWELRDPTIQIAQYTASGCPPILAFSSRNSPNCALVNEFVIRKIELSQPDLVIMAGNWQLYGGNGSWGEVTEAAIRKTLERLYSGGVRRVIGIGQFPVWEAPPSRIRSHLSRMTNINLFASDSTVAAAPTRNRTFVNRSTFETDRKIAPAFEAAGATFIAPTSSLCNSEGCLLIVPTGSDEFIAWDNAHLTSAGSIFFIDANSEAILHR